MSNIHGLGGAKKPAGGAPKGEEFTSQGGTSGTAVWRPTPGAGAGAGAGGGGGGMGDIIGAAKAQAGSTQAQDRNMGVITLYANGFIIGDGEVCFELCVRALLE